MSKTEDIKKSIKKDIKSLKKLSKDKIIEKNNDVKSMINYYRILTDKVEDRRIKHFEFSIQYSILLIAAIALFISVSDKLSHFIYLLLLGIAIIQLLFSIISIGLYTFQSIYPYPFLDMEEFGNKWKWFYYGNKPILQIDDYAITPSKDPSKTTIPYLLGLQNFINSYLHEDDNKSISDNIIHLYLLQVHNYYKNCFYHQLYSISRYSIIITIVYLFLISIITITLSIIGIHY